jgi:hypothetical protein
MKTITGPIDGLTLINRAVMFGNMRDLTDAKAICKKLRVLPPGAPYVINQRGEVFAVARRAKDYSKAVANSHVAMQKVLAHVVRGIAPSIGERLANIEELVIDFSLPSLRWFRVQGFERRRIVEDQTLVVPTLDGLVAASAPVLWDFRKHIRQCPCPTCRRYWIRGGVKAATCGRSACEDWRIKEKNKRSSRNARARHLLRGAN